MTGKLVLEGIVGSHAYGLNRPGSDEDKLGVYVAPAISFLGLHPPQDKSATRTTTDPDVTHHELRKFVRLCLAGNPTVMELLWLERDGYAVRAPIGDDLIALRQAVLSRKRIEDAYYGYADQQFQRLSNRSRFPDVPVARIEKHARHLMRLIRQGVGLWRTGFLELKLQDPERYFEFGEAIAQGRLDLAERELEWARHVFANERSGLPEQPDDAGMNAYVTRIRRRELLSAAHSEGEA